MRLIIGRKKRKKLILKFVLALFLFYILALIFNQYMTIKNKKQAVRHLEEQISEQDVKNEQIIQEIESINNDSQSGNSKKRTFYSVPGN